MFYYCILEYILYMMYCTVGILILKLWYCSCDELCYILVGFVITIKNCLSVLETEKHLKWFDLYQHEQYTYASSSVAHALSQSIHPLSFLCK